MNGFASSAISTAINGGSFSKNLAGSLVSQTANVAAAVGFNAIGGYAETQYLKALSSGDSVGMAMWAEGGVARTALHAVLGGAITSADGGDFATGAIAAGASQAMASVLNNAFQNQAELRAAMSQIVGATAAGLAGKDAAQGSWIAQMGDQYNRQLHQPEAFALSNLKAGLSVEEAAKYDAAACALTRCSASVPTTDPNYESLARLEALGQSASLQQQREALTSTGGFTYDQVDAGNDLLLKTEEARQRIGNGAGAVLGVVSAASLTIATAATVPLCVTGAGCAAPALTGAAGLVSLKVGMDDTAQMFAPYAGTQGANVIASFDPSTYPGESNTAKDLAVSTIPYVAAGAAGIMLVRADAMISSIKGMAGTIGGAVKGAIGDLKGLLGLGAGAKPPVPDVAAEATVGPKATGTPPKVDYSSIENPPNVGPGKDFTLRQKQEALELNKAANGGVVKSDASGVELVRPQKSQRGVTPDPNEWQFDHVDPKSCGGTNCSSNLQILSRQENRAKSDN